MQSSSLPDPADVVVLAGGAITIAGPETSGPVAVAIRNGRITSILPRERARELVGSGTEILDAGERTLLPGFVDPHGHFEVAARTRYLTVDCRAPRCSSISDVLEALRQGLPEARDGWVIGQGNLFFDKKLKEGRFPTREELDSVSRDVALVVRAGGHVSILNSLALERAGIDGAYVEADYSITGRPSVMRDAKGSASGVVKEMDRLLPLPDLSDAELDTAIAEGLTELYTRYGVTSLGEISESRAGLGLMDRGHAREQLGTRLFAYLWVPGTAELAEACDYRSWLGLDSDPARMRVQGVKVFSDGGYSAASAAQTRPYQLEGHGCGEMAMSREQIIEAVVRTADAGLQLAVHANGDRAQLEVCAAVVAARRGLPATIPVPRIEHAGNFLPDYDAAVNAWAEAGIVPVPQPVFLQNFGEFLPEYVGDHAWHTQFPFRRLLDDGWSLSASSDVWVGSEEQQTNPFVSISCCVNRRTFHGQVLNAEQAISVDEALRMHTLGGAEVFGESSSRGSLEVGKLADILVLDRDPRRVPVETIASVQVDQVLLSGRTVFRRDGGVPMRQVSAAQLGAVRP
ncbi:MAG: hypothetical protein JWN22_3366 [Nocardioides sp.]|nr:hypothetical protein [Nocardioides sp.]